MSRGQSGKSLVLSVSASPAGQSLSGPDEAVSEAKRPSSGPSRTEEAGGDQVDEPPDTGLGEETHAPAGNGNQKGSAAEDEGDGGRGEIDFLPPDPEDDISLTGPLMLLNDREADGLFLDGLMKQLESVHKEQGEMDSENGDGDGDGE